MSAKIYKFEPRTNKETPVDDGVAAFICGVAIGIVFCICIPDMNLSRTNVDQAIEACTSHGGLASVRNDRAGWDLVITCKDGTDLEQRKRALGP